MKALEHLIAVCSDPRGQLKSVTESGRKAVGVMPYFCPEELVYAAGMMPFGLWGASIQASESKRYFPAFICSMLHTVLEFGMRGELNDLSAIMIPISCDSLKGMGANWKFAVPHIPVIDVAYAQNRKIAAGTEFSLSQLVKIRRQLEEIAGHEISDADISAAVKVYNENRCAVLAFSDEAAKHPELVSATNRTLAIKAGYFMDRAEHTALLNEITAGLKAAENSPRPRYRVVTTGIMADPVEILRMLDECKFTVVADQVAQESVACRTLTDEQGDAMYALADRYAHIEGCSVLYDPTKNRGSQLVDLVKQTGADAVIWFMCKFCDPEEFDYVPVKKMLAEAGIPLLAIDMDQQMTSFEKARSNVEAFAELLD